MRSLAPGPPPAAANKYRGTIAGAATAKAPPARKRRRVTCDLCILLPVVPVNRHYTCAVGLEPLPAHIVHYSTKASPRAYWLVIRPISRLGLLGKSAMILRMTVAFSNTNWHIRVSG